MARPAEQHIFKLRVNALPGVGRFLHVRQNGLLHGGKIRVAELCFTHHLVEQEQGPFEFRTRPSQNKAEPIPVAPDIDAGFKISQFILDIFGRLIDGGFQEHARKKVRHSAFPGRVKIGSIPDKQPYRHIAAQIRSRRDRDLQVV